MSRSGRTKALLAAAAVAATSVVPAFASTVVAAPTVTTGGPFSYTEQDPPTNIGAGTSIGGGDFYDGKFIDFEITGATADEALSLEPSLSPSTVDGEVSVVGTAVYIGDGSSATPIGSIDAVSDGQGGTKLRVNFGSDFQNAGFETGAVAPWTAVESRVDLGVTEIAGFTTVDTSTYPGNSGGNDDDVPSNLGTYSVAPTSDAGVAPTEGTYALGLVSDNMTTLSTCDIVHGPAAYSAPFDAVSGQTLTFDWRAFAGDDAFAVFGYLLNTSDGTQTEVLDQYALSDTATTNWAAVNVIVPATATYRFVFVSGTYDFTCGRAAGASLYVDNFQVVSSNLVDSDIVTKVAELLTYENTSDDPEAVRTVTVTAENVADETDSGTITINIAAVNDVPESDPISESWTNFPGDDTFTDITGTLSFTDPDDGSVTYGIQGGTPGSYSPAGGGSYDVLMEGTYGDLYVDSATGAYRLVADDAAIEAVTDPSTEPFTVTADDGEDTGSAILTLGIDLPPSPRTVVGTPGDSQISVDWDVPIDSAGVTGYTATVAPGGQSCTTTDLNDTDCVITGLTNGTDYVVTVTATGTGVDSLPSDPVTPVGPPTAPQNLTGTPGDGRILVQWDPPANDGGSAITGYTVTTSPGGATCTTTGATNCTILGLAEGQTYSVTVDATNALGTGPDASAIDVDVLAPSSTVLVSSDSEITAGDSVTLTATVTADTPSGTVEFFDGTTSLGSIAVSGGTAELVTTALVAGTRSITAVYSGDVDTNPSTSSAIEVDVLTAASVDLAVDDDEPTEGDTIIFTATVTGDSPSGTVEFFDGATSLGTVALAGGVAELEVDSLLDGAHTVTAVYSGDTQNGDATSSGVAVTVLEPTTVSVSVDDETPDVGDSITLTAVVDGAAPSGTVEFFDGDVSLGVVVLDGGEASLVVDDLVGGVYEITVVYSGDVANAGSTSSTLELALAAPVIELEVEQEDGGDVDNAPVDIVGEGLEPDSEVEIVFGDGEGESLGTLIVDGTGTVTGSVTLPEGIEPGEHEVTVIGTGADGFPVVESLTIFVDWSGAINDQDSDLGGYVGVEPTRIVDTRAGAKIAARGVHEFTVDAALVEADVTAVVVNVAVTLPEARGHLTVYPCDTDRPLAATLNYGAGDTISNLAIAGFEIGDTLCVYTLAEAHVVIDLNGFFRASAPDRFAELDQVRLLDSRTEGPRVAGGAVVEIDVIGDGLAPEGTEAVNLYIASDQPVERGHLTVYPCDADRPVAANLNYAAGQTIGNNVIAKVGGDGTVCVFTKSATHIVVDMHGVMSDAGLAQMTTLVPGRFVDTRVDQKVAARTELVLDFSEEMPAGTVAVELNVAATEAEARGHIRVYPCDGELPLVASLNYPEGGSASGHVTATLGEAGTICVFTLSTAHIVVDVQGMHIANVT